MRESYLETCEGWNCLGTFGFSLAGHAPFWVRGVGVGSNDCAAIHGLNVRTKGTYERNRNRSHVSNQSDRKQGQ